MENQRIQGSTMVVVQFSDMLHMMQVGWVKAPAGHVCPECAGPLWIKDVGG